MKYLEEKYGHPSDVFLCGKPMFLCFRTKFSYVENLIELPSMIEWDVPKIHRFYEQLLFNVKSLETLGKLNIIQGATFYVIKKLEVVKAELVSHILKDWREWIFKELLEPYENGRRPMPTWKCRIATKARTPLNRPQACGRLTLAIMKSSACIVKALITRRVCVTRWRRRVRERKS